MFYKGRDGNAICILGVFFNMHVEYITLPDDRERGRHADFVRSDDRGNAEDASNELEELKFQHVRSLRYASILLQSVHYLT